MLPPRADATEGHPEQPSGGLGATRRRATKSTKGLLGFLSIVPSTLGAGFIGLANFDELTGGAMVAASLVAGLAGTWTVYSRMQQWDGPIMSRMVLNRLLGPLIPTYFAFAIVGIVAFAWLGSQQSLLAFIPVVSYPYYLLSAFALTGEYERVASEARKPIGVVPADGPAEERGYEEKVAGAMGRLAVRGGPDVVVRAIVEPESRQRERLREFSDHRPDISGTIAVDYGIVSMAHENQLIVPVPPEMGFDEAMALIQVVSHISMSAARTLPVGLMPENLSREARSALERVWTTSEVGATDVRPPQGPRPNDLATGP